MVRQKVVKLKRALSANKDGLLIRDENKIKNFLREMKRMKE